MKFVIISLISFICALAIQSKKMKTKDASVTGKNFSLSGTMLSGSLRDMKQVYKSSKIDLNTAIANLNGKLTFQANGNYGASCRGCTLRRFQLTCNCQNSAGRHQKTTLNLGSNMQNLDGKFAYVK